MVAALAVAATATRVVAMAVAATMGADISGTDEVNYFVEVHGFGWCGSIAAQPGPHKRWGMLKNSLNKFQLFREV